MALITKRRSILDDSPYNGIFFSFLLKYFVLVPPVKLCSIYGVHCCIQITFWLGALLGWGYWIFRTFRDELSYFLTDLYVLSVVWLVATNVYCSMCVIYLRKSEFSRLETALGAIKGHFRGRTPASNCFYNDGNRLVHVVATHAIFFLLIAANVNAMFQRTVVTQVFVYCIHWYNLMFSTHYFNEIWRFKELIRMCNRHISRKAPQVNLVLVNYLHQLDRKELVFLLNSFENIFELIELYNLTYGRQILARVASAICRVLIVLFVVLQGYLSNYSFFSLMDMFWAIGEVVMIFLSMIQLTSQGKEVMDELDETATICHKLILDISKNSKKRDGALVKNLSILAHRLRFKRPQFSAAGFFPINKTMLFIITNVSASYLIIMLQYGGSFNI